MTLDSRQRTTTAIACGVLVVVSIVVPLAVRSAVALVAPVFALVVLGISWAMSPLEIVVAQGELRVERRAWSPARFPLASVAQASAVDALGPGALRVFGVGGFFGSYGLFRSERLGNFRMYATHSGQAVLVTLKGSELPLVITPDDVVGALGSIDRRAAA
jgi:Bacterial PH domain